MRAGALIGVLASSRGGAAPDPGPVYGDPFTYTMMNSYGVSGSNFASKGNYLTAITDLSVTGVLCRASGVVTNGEVVVAKIIVNDGVSIEIGEILARKAFTSLSAGTTGTEITLDSPANINKGELFLVTWVNQSGSNTNASLAYFDDSPLFERNGVIRYISGSRRPDTDIQEGDTGAWAEWLTGTAWSAEPIVRRRGARDFPVTLVNPGAEAGNTTGWINTGVEAVTSRSDATPHTGSYFFVANQNPANIVQFLAFPPAILTAIAAGTKNLLVRWEQYSDAATDAVQVTVRFYDSSDLFLSHFFTGWLRPTAGVWSSRTVTNSIPTNAAFYELEIGFLRFQGLTLDAYVDDIEISFTDD